MFDVDLVVTVIFLFFTRIGLPILLLFSLGAIVGRWQTRRMTDATTSVNELQAIRNH